MKVKVKVAVTYADPLKSRDITNQKQAGRTKYIQHDILGGVCHSAISAQRAVSKQPSPPSARWSKVRSVSDMVIVILEIREQIYKIGNAK